MTREEATKAAQAAATESGVRIAVTVNRYSEDPEGDNFGFLPEKSARILKYDEVIEVLNP